MGSHRKLLVSFVRLADETMKLLTAAQRHA
jgi:hypothetical protein